MIIDISQHNAVTDFEKIKQNVDGVIIRMGYTGYSSGKIVYDKKFFSNTAALKDIPCGFYFFPQSLNDEEAIKEADWIRHALPQDYPLGLWLDSELAEPNGKGRADKLNRSDRTRFLLIIIRRLAGYGIRCGVYGSTSWLNSKLDMSMLSDVPVWVAQYNTQCTYKGDYELWQYSSKGSIPGLKGNVDLNKRPDAVELADLDDDRELKAAVDIFADRIIKGKFGQGHDNRARNIYSLIRARVNDIFK